jgi:phenylpropionate dioxygenase-like ring-hydroxylating dioxygenase large terminal subunit
VTERAGVIWVYLGARAAAPPLPAFEILDLPDDEIRVSFIQRECNYLQAVEGEIDTSHFGFLHAGHVDVDDLAEAEPLRYTVTDRSPGRSRQHLLAFRQLPVSVLESGTEWRVRQPHACARLGAARR